MPTCSQNGTRRREFGKEGEVLYPRAKILHLMWLLLWFNDAFAWFADFLFTLQTCRLKESITSWLVVVLKTC